jgi:signal transduction histidine kinase
MRLGRQDLQLLSPLASGLAVTLGNATQVAQIKEEKSTLEQILGLSSDGILLLDGKGRVRVWNQAMERITGVPAEEAVGLPYNEWLAGRGHDGRPVRLSEGLERWLRCNHSLLYEGEEWTTDVVIVHDVTRIRQAERAKTDFVATVSHELRTPITPIKGYVEILQARGPNLSEDRRQDMLRIVAERADHLARLVEDLLLASRISSEPGGATVVDMRRECTDLAEAARRAAADWRRGPDSRLELELPDGPLEVDADPLRLVQVLANLISNAHKYSPPTRRCGCGCGATTAGRWPPWPTGAGASPVRSWTGCSRSSTGSRTP